jgi:hypothetical protein
MRFIVGSVAIIGRFRKSSRQGQVAAGCETKFFAAPFLRESDKNDNDFLLAKFGASANLRLSAEELSRE